MIDAFRKVRPEPELYTWWSNRGQARKNNVGWRIDYQVTSKRLKNSIHSAEIDTSRNMSDHAPVSINYRI